MCSFSIPPTFRKESALRFPVARLVLKDKPAKFVRVDDEQLLPISNDSFNHGTVAAIADDECEPEWYAHLNLITDVNEPTLVHVTVSDCRDAHYMPDGTRVQT